jgi:hypothetical protein
MDNNTITSSLTVREELSFMMAENRTTSVERSGFQDKVILIKEGINTVLMVRVREEFSEPDDVAITRAHAIADALTIKYKRTEVSEG